MEKIFLQGSYKQKNIEAQMIDAQTNFHYDKQHGFSQVFGKMLDSSKLILTLDGIIG